MSSAWSSIGTSVDRRDGTHKVQGRTLYSADVRLDGTLHGAILRSPLPYARITRIDVNSARAVPGVHAVLTGLDIPDRLAGRILGMGDILGLVEKAAEAVDQEEAARLERKLRTAKFDFNDFLTQFKMMRRLGPLENILGMLPGMSNVPGLSVDEKQLGRIEAIVLSMTLEERARPDILNARRRQRIARGSGRTVTEVNDLLQRFNQMRKLMKNAGKMKKMMAQMARMQN